MAMMQPDSARSDPRSRGRDARRRREHRPIASHIASPCRPRSHRHLQRGVVQVTRVSAHRVRGAYTGSCFTCPGRCRERMLEHHACRSIWHRSRVVYRSRRRGAARASRPVARARREPPPPRRAQHDGGGGRVRRRAPPPPLGDPRARPKLSPRAPPATTASPPTRAAAASVTAARLATHGACPPASVDAEKPRARGTFENESGPHPPAVGRSGVTCTWRKRHHSVCEEDPVAKRRSGFRQQRGEQHYTVPTHGLFPCAGSRRRSAASAAPTKTTPRPRSRRAAATAGAGPHGAHAPKHFRRSTPIEICDRDRPVRPIRRHQQPEAERRARPPAPAGGPGRSAGHAQYALRCGSRATCGRDGEVDAERHRSMYICRTRCASPRVLPRTVDLGPSGCRFTFAAACSRSAPRTLPEARTSGAGPRAHVAAHDVTTV